MIGEKRYLGGGVYVQLMDTGMLRLTDDGIRVASTTTIYLEGSAYRALEQYVKDQGLEITAAQLAARQSAR